MQADDLLSLMGDDEEMRSNLAEALGGSGKRADSVLDVGRLRS